MGNIKTPRKLALEEHGRTRKLWETAFYYDPKSFVDYYYDVKVKQNEIYVIEDDEKVICMIHLNPYQVRVGEEVHKLHYIVGVATDPEYRKQGHMRRLLNYVMDVMAERGEPFTYLMPIDEAIYRPFGFETVYMQSRKLLCGKKQADSKLTIRNAKIEDGSTLAEFANRFLDSYDVVSVRDETYYETAILEFGSEDGGVLVAEKDGNIVGIFHYGIGERYEILEPLFEKDEDFLYAVYLLTNSEEEEVHCMGYGEEPVKPIIMTKSFKPGMQEWLKTAKVFLNEVV